MQINLAKYLKITNIGHRVRSNILRVELEAGEYILEIFSSGRAKPSVQMMYKNNYFSILRFRRVFSNRDSPMNDFLL